MVARALFAAGDAEWTTPQALFDALHAKFSFVLDAAASAQNAKCARYFTREDDGLAQDWVAYGRVWLNPPYGRRIGRWMEKARKAGEAGCLVVCLVPARTDTRWWHEQVRGHAQVTFLRGRLRFTHPCRTAAAGAAFPSALVIYGLDFDQILNQGPGARLGRSASVRSLGADPEPG